MLQEGQVIGTYELARRLGAGTFGEVWLARHIDLDVERALKIPTDPDYVRQLRQEAKLQLTLRHPNIVQTWELNTRHDPPYFVMEYVEGENLRTRLTRERKLPVDAALGILCQVLEALKAAHAEGVFHRDLKPANILLTPDDTVKITDFGLGKVQAQVARSLTLSGSMTTRERKSISGTIAYMSPRQEQGEEPAPSDDLYALGIITCELLTGSRPRAGLSIGDMFGQAALEPVLASIVTIALGLLEHRYQSADGMLADLHEVERGRRAEAERRRREEEERRRKAEEEKADAERRLREQAEAERRRQEEARLAEIERKRREEEDRRRRAEEQKAEAERKRRRQEQARRAEIECKRREEQDRRRKAEEQKAEAERKRREEAEAERLRQEAEREREQKDREQRIAVRLFVGMVIAVWVAGGIAFLVWGRFPFRGRSKPPTAEGWPFDAQEAKRRQREAAKALSVPVEQEIDLGGGVKLTMVLIPAGEFVIGSPKDEEERDDDEDQKRVRIEKAFWMAKHELTQEQWQAVMGSNPSHSKGARNPVEQVSWNDIQQFLKKLNARVGGRPFALPTEAQWEYACRAGTATPFHFGETISTDQANCDGDYTYGRGRKGVDREKTVPVGSFPANAWGLHDMHGNLWEWCASPYSEKYDGSEQKGADAEGGFRVLRGGSWAHDPNYCRSANRLWRAPTDAHRDFGFRVCRVPRTPE